ncbi:MAG: hypothetical protein JXK94_03255 [Deltaproteobacteria bacterium]|nr:hypothetical protein [Deltaproteobacteria bacterium]
MIFNQRAKFCKSRPFRLPVHFLIQSYLFSHRQLFSAAALFVLQTYAAAIIGTPLALFTVVAGMFFVHNKGLSA